MINCIDDFIKKIKMLLLINSSKIDNGFYKYLYYRQNIIINYIDFQLTKRINQLFCNINNQNLKVNILNFIYRFFQNYYDNGFFVNKQQAEIIHYEDKDLKLYQSTRNCYYVGSLTLLQDYVFVLGNYNISYAVSSGQTGVFNVMDDKNKYYILKNIEIIQNDIKFLFQFRELSQVQINEYHFINNGNIYRQREMNRYVVYNNLVEKFREKQLQFIYKELNKFTKKKRVDYFIHKDLKKFLGQQLIYYIKNEIIDIDVLQRSDFNDDYITLVKMVHNIGSNIIEFLAQIEDYQKKIWEEKRLILTHDYVITLDKIKEYAGQDFLFGIQDIILNNIKQINEWKELQFGDIKCQEDLYLKKDLFDIEYKKLPLDTKYFPIDFKEQLLKNLTKNYNLDNILDGLLIKSESYQALNTIMDKYKGCLRTVYIDPPFNKEQDADYLYNVKYKNSTWVSLLENRLFLSKKIMNDRASIFVRCDYSGNWILRSILNEIYGEDNFRNEIILKRISKQDPKVKRFNTSTDTLYFYSKSNNYMFELVYKNLKKVKEERWHSMDSQGNGQALYIFGNLLEPPKGRHWTYSQSNIKSMENEQKIRIVCRNCGYIHSSGKWDGCPKCKTKNNVRVEYLLSPTEKKQIDSNWCDIPGYSQTWNFSTENSEVLLKRIIESTSDKGNLVMDFFLGSGTTTAVAQKLRRKWIGIEMGDHFWTVIIPRMKKVLFYDKSGISKDKDVKKIYNENQAGGFFQYQVLEQYEDRLNKIYKYENL